MQADGGNMTTRAHLGGEELVYQCWRHDAVCNCKKGEPWQAAARKLHESSVTRQNDVELTNFST